MLNFLDINKETILKEGNPVLREKSKEVELPISQSTQQLIDKMEKYLIESNDEEMAEKKNLEPAVGIAAPQIGKNINIFSLFYEEEDGKVFVRTYINPKITKKSKELAYLENGEGCLSVPKKKDGYIYRNAQIGVSYYNKLGEEIKELFDDFYAIAFQHEYDHLQGKLYTDYIEEEDPYKEIKGAIKI